jgi:hypothetical protein
VQNTSIFENVSSKGHPPFHIVVLGPKQKKMVGAHDEVTNMWEKLCLMHFSLVFFTLSDKLQH